LALALGDDIPVYGLQARGLDGTAEPHRSVEAAAQDHIDTLRGAGLQGGCTLVGHSFGGWIAFEMARQLRDGPLAVDQLVLLDSRNPAQAARQAHSPDRIDALLKFAHLIKQQTGKALALDRQSLQAADPSTQIHLLHQAMISAKALPARTPVQHLAGIFKVFDSNLRTRYLPDARLDHPAVVYAQAGEQGEARHDWLDLADLQQHLTLAANHMTLLERPHIDAIARAIHGHRLLFA
jgi:thioesterase domain-containing protein